MITIGRAPQLLAAAAAIVAAFLCAARPAAAQFVQQGAKLVGDDYVANGEVDIEQGIAVAVSADGSTAVVGGPGDNTYVGATWVYTRVGGVWTQQGSKLVGNGAGAYPAKQGSAAAVSADGNTLIEGGPFAGTFSGQSGAAWVFTRSGGVWTEQATLIGTGILANNAAQGASVALSADGNTAIVGGYYDDNEVGAAWVFTRGNGVWTQQAKLVGTGYVAGGFVEQGISVALSNNGNTAIVGGFDDNSSIGAAWIFTRSNGVWSQQGAKLTASDEAGQGEFGFSVALSGDGNTAVVGGPGDNNHAGATWIFTQSGGVWTQQGLKLVGTGAINGQFGAQQGISVSLSGDATLLLVGANGDDSAVGAAWVFTQSGGVWSQQGSKLVGNGYDASGGSVDQGTSVALSANGRTAVVGGQGDNSGVGAAWVFVSTPFADRTNSHDFNGDGVSDILWRDTSNDVAMWLMSAGQESSGATLGNAGGSWSVVGQRDFNGDGDADLLWLDTSGDLGLWLMNGASVDAQIGLGNVGASWSVVGTGDFNGDGTGDILWRDGSGDLAIWLMRNGKFSSGVSLGQVASDWSVAGTGDFNGDGTTDILWRNTATGDLAIWFMSNGRVSSAVDVTNVTLAWSVAGTGDFDGDGTSDILWRDASGDYAIWLISNGQFSSGATIASGVPNSWSVTETGDFDGDGKSDLLWTDTSGDLGVWLMNGTTVSSANGLGNVGASWTVQGKNAD